MKKNQTTIFIVTGSTLAAEKKDRPLAYKVKRAISRLNTLDFTADPIVISDLWYLNNKELQEYPVISIGGPGVNALSALLYQELPYALAVDNTFIIQMDVMFEDIRVAVWGMNQKATVAAVNIFIRREYLSNYLYALARQNSEMENSEIIED